VTTGGQKAGDVAANVIGILGGTGDTYKNTYYEAVADPALYQAACVKYVAKPDALLVKPSCEMKIPVAATKEFISLDQQWHQVLHRWYTYLHTRRPDRARDRPRLRRCIFIRCHQCRRECQ